jgi:hypothetical protein
MKQIEENLTYLNTTRGISKSVFDRIETWVINMDTHIKSQINTQQPYLKFSRGAKPQSIGDRMMRTINLSNISETITPYVLKRFNPYGKG